MKSSPWRSLIGLNFLRVVLAMAALLAFAGAAILVRFTSPDAHPHSGLAFMLFLPLAGMICFVWPMLNWLLSLACIFAVRDGDDVLSAISAAVTFSRERSGPVFAVSIWTGLAHLTAFSIATTAISFPLAFLRIAPARLIAQNGADLRMLEYGNPAAAARPGTQSGMPRPADVLAATGHQWPDIPQTRAN